MKIKTLNSEYIVNGNELWRNGELFSEDVRKVCGVAIGWQFYDGIPKVGDMMYVEYGTRSLRTSTITEIEQC